MCDDLVMYVSACVLRHKMACAVKLDYSEEEVHRFNLTLSSDIHVRDYAKRQVNDYAKRQVKGQGVWFQI